MYSQLTVLAFYEECGFSSISETALSWVKFTDAEGTLRVGTKKKKKNHETLWCYPKECKKKIC